MQSNLPQTPSVPLPSERMPCKIQSDFINSITKVCDLTPQLYYAHRTYSSFNKRTDKCTANINCKDSGSQIVFRIATDWKLLREGHNVYQEAEGIRLMANRGGDNKSLVHTLLQCLISSSPEVSLRRFQDAFNLSLPDKTPDAVFTGTTLTFLELKTGLHCSSKIYDDAVRKYDMSAFEPLRKTANIAIFLSGQSLWMPAGAEVSADAVDFLCSVCGFIHQTLIAKKSYHQNQNIDGTIKIPKVDLTPRRDDSILSITDEYLQRMIEVVPRDRFTPQMAVEIQKPREATSSQCWPVKHENAIVGFLPDFPIVLSPSKKRPDATLISNPFLRHLATSYWVSRNYDSRHFLPTENREERKIGLEGPIETLIVSNPKDISRGLWLKDLVDHKVSHFNNHDLDFIQVQKLRRKLERKKATWRDSIASSTVLEIIRRRDEEHENSWITSQDQPVIRQDLNALVSEILSSTREGLMEADLPVIHTNHGGNQMFQEEAWSQHMRFWQLVYSELNIGIRGAQTKNKKRFLAQRLGDFDAYIFSQSKGSGQHIFFYLLVHSSAKMFRLDDWEELNDGWFCTKNVMSVTPAAIEQRLYSFNKLYTLRVFFEDKVEDWKENFAMCVWISLEAKQRTLDLLSLMRYIYMEMSKPYLESKPDKIFGKIDLPLRTRLDQHIVACMSWLVGFHRDRRPELLQAPSWITTRPTGSFRTIVNLSYFQHVIKSQQTVGLTSVFKTAKKIITEEEKLTQDVANSIVRLDEINFADLRSHQFSPSFVAMLGFFGSKRLKKEFKTFQDFRTAWFNELQDLEYEDFATFKKTTDMSIATRSHRDYCIAKVNNMVVSYLDSPYQDLESLVKEQRNRADSRALTIFMKDQQTGVREIFVLPIIMRILIKSLECMSELICKRCMKNEALSNPKLKDVFLNIHQSKVFNKMKALRKMYKSQKPKQYIGEYKFMASSDAKTWCQQFTMPNFMQMFVGLFYSAYGEEVRPLLKYIAFVLNQITNKEIVFDEAAVRWCQDLTLEELNQIYSRNDEFSSFVKILRREKKHGEFGFKNESNMMQGITHYVSSLLHSLYLEFAATRLNIFTKNLLEELAVNVDWDLISDGMVIDTIVSSDDSGIYCTLNFIVGYEHESDLSRIKARMDRVADAISSMGKQIDLLKPLIGARLSVEKSTEFSQSETFEFNSRFFYKTSEYVPEIKFCTAAFHPGFHEFPSERVDEALSSLNASLTNGLSQSVMRAQQLMLNRMHHHLITNRIDYSDLELELRSPIIGWVPLMPQGLIGIMNMQQITSFLVLTSDPNSDLYNARYFLESEVMDTKVRLSLLRRTKLNKMLSKMGITREFVTTNLINLGPEFLINRLPQNLKIAIKMLSPGTNTALAFTSLSKLHSVSCYSNTRQVFTTKIPSEESLKMTYTEMLQWIKTNRSLLPKINVDFYDTPEIKYLASIDWSNCQEITKNLVVRPFDRKVNKFYLKALKILPDTRSVLSDCYDYWIGTRNPRNEIFFEYLKTLDTRIKDSYAETIEAFHSRPQELKMFLMNIELKDKRISYFGPALHQQGFQVHMANYLKHNWSDQFSLILEKPKDLLIGESIDEKAIQKAWEGVSQYLSNAFGGWRALMTYWLDLATNKLRDIDIPEARSENPDVQLMLLWLKHRKNPFHLIPVTRYIKKSVTCLFLSSTCRIIRINNRWVKSISYNDRIYHEDPTSRARDRFEMTQADVHESMVNEYCLSSSQMKLVHLNGSMYLTTTGNLVNDRSSFCCLPLKPIELSTYSPLDSPLSDFIKTMSRVVLFSPNLIFNYNFITRVQQFKQKGGLDQRDRAVYREFYQMLMDQDKSQEDLANRIQRRIDARLRWERGEYAEPEVLLDEDLALSEDLITLQDRLVVPREEEEKSPEMFSEVSLEVEAVIEQITRSIMQEPTSDPGGGQHHEDPAVIDWGDPLDEEEAGDIDDALLEWAQEHNMTVDEVGTAARLEDALMESWEDPTAPSVLYWSGGLLIPAESRNCWVMARREIQKAKLAGEQALGESALPFPESV
uniref:RNA-directed RNA polymerase L n=1 Tax=Leptomonas pyrrhocoris leishbunyavirus 3 TaxID=3070841 RepID=A0AA50Q9G5_9VIRU|nr:RNA-dependent RNA polymerase [Leptomonas pyrrhocoris leishbunyavirus 3]